MFKTVHELKIGDPVKMAGVTIGGVARIVLTNSMAEVTMNLEPGGRRQDRQQGEHQLCRINGAGLRLAGFWKPGRAACD